MLHLSPRCPGKDRCFSELGWAACSRFVERWLCALSSNGAYLVGLSWMLSCGEEFETDFDRQFQRQGAQEKRLYVKKLSKQTDSNNFLRLQHILARHWFQHWMLYACWWAAGGGRSGYADVESRKPFRDVCGALAASESYTQMVAALVERGVGVREEAALQSFFMQTWHLPRRCSWKWPACLPVLLDCNAVLKSLSGKLQMHMRRHRQMQNPRCQSAIAHTKTLCSRAARRS